MLAKYKVDQLFSCIHMWSLCFTFNYSVDTIILYSVVIGLRKPTQTKKYQLTAVYTYLDSLLKVKSCTFNIAFLVFPYDTQNSNVRITGYGETILGYSGKFSHLASW